MQLTDNAVFNKNKLNFLTKFNTKKQMQQNSKNIIRRQTVQKCFFVLK